MFWQGKPGPQVARRFVSWAMQAEASTFHSLCSCARKVTAAIFWLLYKFTAICRQVASIGPSVEVRCQ